MSRKNGLLPLAPAPRDVSINALVVRSRSPRGRDARKRYRLTASAAWRRLERIARRKRGENVRQAKDYWPITWDPHARFSRSW